MLVGTRRRARARREVRFAHSLSEQNRKPSRSRFPTFEFIISTNPFSGRFTNHPISALRNLQKERAVKN